MTPTQLNRDHATTPGDRSRQNALAMSVLQTQFQTSNVRHPRQAQFAGVSDAVELARGPRAIARIFFNIRSPLLNSEPHLKRNSDLEIRSFSARLSEPYGLIGCPRKPERPDPIDDDWCSLVTPAFGYWLGKPSLGMLLWGRAKDFHNGHYATNSHFDSRLSLRPRNLL